MKRYIALLLALLLLTGCGAKQSAQSGEAGSLSGAQPEESAPAAESAAASPERDPMDGATESVPSETERGTASTSAASSAVPEVWDAETTWEHTLCFAGDVNLAEGQYTTAALDASGLENCVSESLREHMTGADVMCLNNEFTYTTRGTPLEGKTYTYRASPSRVETLKALGVDLAVLANNHVYDYGEEGLLDTLETLRAAELPYIGAGENLEEASSIYYAELGDCTVAYVAASRVEWEALTRPATSDGMGVFYTAYDTDLLCQRVREAKEQADYVVVYLHWGIEGTDELEAYQVDTGALLAEAGADLVVGDHPHQLQGICMEGETPILYSMGNYWFSRKDEYTMLLEVTLRGDKHGLRETRLQIVPARQTSEAKVRAIEGAEEQRAMYDWLESLPGSNVRIDDHGKIEAG